MSFTQITAPFTPEQVAALNRWQERGDVHPFTCGNSQCRSSHPNDALVATPNGWMCRHCDYTQQWAHGFMAKHLEASE
jgi:hypothetical protein